MLWRHSIVWRDLHNLSPCRDTDTDTPDLIKLIEKSAELNGLSMAPLINHFIDGLILGSGATVSSLKMLMQLHYIESFFYASEERNLSAHPHIL